MRSKIEVEEIIGKGERHESGCWLDDDEDAFHCDCGAEWRNQLRAEQRERLG